MSYKQRLTKALGGSTCAFMCLLSLYRTHMAQAEAQVWPQCSTGGGWADGETRHREFGISGPWPSWAWGAQVQVWDPRSGTPTEQSCGWNTDTWAQFVFAPINLNITPYPPASLCFPEMPFSWPPFLHNIFILVFLTLISWHMLNYCFCILMKCKMHSCECK